MTREPPSNMRETFCASLSKFGIVATIGAASGGAFAAAGAGAGDEEVGAAGTACGASCPTGDADRISTFGAGAGAGRSCSTTGAGFALRGTGSFFAATIFVAMDLISAADLGVRLGRADFGWRLGCRLGGRS